MEEGAKVSEIFYKGSKSKIFSFSGVGVGVWVGVSGWGAGVNDFFSL